MSTVRLIVQAVLGSFIVAVIITACGKKESTEQAAPKPSVQCNAMYREASDGMGTMFQFDAANVRCYGRIGQSKAECVWRRLR